MPGEEAEAGAGWSERKCLQSTLLWMVVLSLDVAQGYKSGRAGRGDRTVHTLAPQMGNPRPREGRELPKAAQLHRDRAGLGPLLLRNPIYLQSSKRANPVLSPPQPGHASTFLHVSISSNLDMTSSMHLECKSIQTGQEIIKADYSSAIQ